jgi:zinc/manganese transport system substrate-binding protein
MIHSSLSKMVFVLGFSLLISAGEVSAKLRVVTTLPSFADIAAAVGGEEVDAQSLTRGRQDPHFVDAKPDLMLKLGRADVMIHAGLGLEDGWLPPLLTGARNAKIQPGSLGNITASNFIQLLEVPQGKVERSQGDVHPGGNPHFMLDPRNGVVLAQALADKFGELDPSHRELFQSNAKRWIDDLKKEIAGWEKQLSKWKGRTVVTYHRSWSYFLAWSGIKLAATVEPKPGIPPSPEHVVSLVQQIRREKIGTILVEPYYPKSVAEQVARETGAKLLVLPTEVQGAEGVDHYPQIFQTIGRELVVQ